LFLRLEFQRFDGLQRRPALALLGVGLDLVVEGLLVGVDMLVHELEQALLQVLGAG